MDDRTIGPLKNIPPNQTTRKSASHYPTKRGKKMTQPKKKTKEREGEWRYTWKEGSPAHSVSCRQPSNSIATTHATFSSCTRSSSSFINSTSLPLFHASRNKQEKQKTNCFGIMPGLTIGDTIPDLVADSTHGKIKLHEYIGASWTIIFSHPG